MQQQKEFFAHAIQMVEVEESPNIPTVVLYKPQGAILIGHAALSESSESQPVNEDFKIDLGRYAPTVVSKKRLKTAAGADKTAAQLADDFLFEVLKLTRQWLTGRGIAECRNVIVAEPLSMHTEEVSRDWLDNYRQTLKRLLEGKTLLSPGGMDVDFIPEPFAVFQYYRHGIRHPQVAQRMKMNALVIDFGGGTCDVCIIETTKEGDISYGGRNKRPLAAGSIPVGGFQINRAIAEQLVKKQFPSADAAIKNGLRCYKDWREGNAVLEAYAAKYINFVNNFHELVHRVENLKLALCRRVSDWSLTSDQRYPVPIGIPVDMFATKPRHISITFSIGELREVFIQKIYQPYLKPFILKRVENAHDLLQGAPITVLLLSGGSANIGWLTELIHTELVEAVDRAPVVRIPDYQEVVAKGLAAECARRFASGTGDFAGVTYNPLNLLLEADEPGCEARPFRRRMEELPDVQQTPGLLLPTASVMSSFIDKPMRWKVKLNRAPRHRLDYYFLQASLDPADTAHLQNVEEHTVYTPEGGGFDRGIQVQLTVRGDGTATPRFIYRAGRSDEEEVGKEGRKFFVDMTYSKTSSREAYLGLDFGTSNSAVSYISRSWVQLTDTRIGDRQWRELGELIDLLPCSLAIPLARYIGQFGEYAPTPPEFSFLEAALTLAAYVAFCEYCALEQPSTRLFKDFRQRSAGPLWQFFRNTMKQLGRRVKVAAPFNALCEGRNAELVNAMVDTWAQVKHEKALGKGLDMMGTIRVVANVCNEAFSKFKFGYFEAVRKKLGGRYSGRFRVAHGRAPFPSFYHYTGPEAFSEADALLVNAETGTGLTLTPLAFWYPCSAHRDVEAGHCFFYDKSQGEGANQRVTFKAAGFPCHLDLTAEHEELGEVCTVLAKWRTCDPNLSFLSDLSLAEG